MNELYVKVMKRDPRAIIPTKREEDAGFDLYALYDEEYHVLEPHEVWLAPTGISTEFSKNWVLLLHERSSTGTKGIARRAGVIDSGYRGEIKVAIQNLNTKKLIFIKKTIEEEEVLKKENFKREEVLFYPQEKAIIQGIFMYAPHTILEEVQELDVSERLEGGFGSTEK